MSPKTVLFERITIRRKSRGNTVKHSMPILCTSFTEMHTYWVIVDYPNSKQFKLFTKISSVTGSPHPSFSITSLKYWVSRMKLMFHTCYSTTERINPTIFTPVSV